MRDETQNQTTSCTPSATRSTGASLAGPRHRCSSRLRPSPNGRSHAVAFFSRVHPSPQPAHPSPARFRLPEQPGRPRGHTTVPPFDGGGCRRGHRGALATSRNAAVNRSVERKAHPFDFRGPTFRLVLFWCSWRSICLSRSRVSIKPKRRTN